MTYRKISCFKAYDVRGRLGEQLDEDVVYRIGRAYAEYFNADRVVVGGDARETSPSLKAALASGLQDAGCDVFDLGLVGTEEIYFATSDLMMDGGIMVTASHNPIDYNGIKFVGKGSYPISSNSGLGKIEEIAERGLFLDTEKKGRYVTVSHLLPYVDHLLRYIDLSIIPPTKIVVNSGNGVAGHVVDEIERRFIQANVPVEFIKIHHTPDSSFPNGIPNPLLPENRSSTAITVQENNADFGIAWDGDFDRCFFFDENGNFIEGYYIVGLLAEAFLQKNAGERIIYDPRVYWNTEDIIRKYDGVAIKSKTGHAFIKERMRQEDAVYGGEMSAHHYFRDFFYCDSGMIPWLLILELIGRKEQRLSALLEERIALYPSSGEKNFRVDDSASVLLRIENWAKQLGETEFNYTDGLSVSFRDWRFNIRKSNTEELLRLNVESYRNIGLLNQKVLEISKLIRNEG